MRFFHTKKIWKNVLITIVILYAAYWISRLILPLTGVENNSALVFVLAVAGISMLTDGYVYGILASLVSAFCINYFFMYPYSQFNVSLSGYPIAILSNFSIAVIVSTLMGRIKKHAIEAEEREQKTKELSEKNAILEDEKNKVKLKALEAETRSNIMMAVSHDLRTPLTAISGSASVILSQGKEGCSEENLKLVADIKDDANWLSAMVENILVVTKLKDEKATLQMRSEVLDDIIESALVKMKKRFPDSTINYIPANEVLLVFSDPLLIQQVLINLMDNSLRHSGSKKGIEIKVTALGDNAEISIRDFGSGLPEEVLEQIVRKTPVMLERRADSSRGIGIGLSVCQSILKAHNTELCAENPEDGGCRLFFNIGLDKSFEEE